MERRYPSPVGLERGPVGCGGGHRRSLCRSERSGERGERWGESGEGEEEGEVFRFVQGGGGQEREDEEGQRTRMWSFSLSAD